MVYIKKIEIFGFKSFGSKNITLNLQKGLIAVTGPNGSGKSNILDAILFALGENSPKALRVDRFQSLFHDSSPSNNPNKIVKVSLTFDNTDRGIPIDNDTVTIAREMSGSNSGESQYYIGGRKVSRNNIMELLEIVVASPNKLNIVQQGMITRISELNPDERRKIIEDIIGLSYFDEKKNQAMKQLDESDRRLEIALTKMNEVRNRIDELEAERNDQYRFMHLESEIKRLKAIKISDNLKTIEKKIETSRFESERNENKIANISKEIDELDQQNEKINQEKDEFIAKSNTSNKEKIEIDRKLSSIIYKYERTNAIIKETEYYLNQINQREKNNSEEQQIQIKKLDEYKMQLKKLEGNFDDIEKKRMETEEKIKQSTSEIDMMNNNNQGKIEQVRSLRTRANKLSLIKKNIEIDIVRYEEKIKNISNKIVDNDKILRNTLLERTQYNNTIESLKNSNGSIKNIIDGLEDNENKKEIEFSKLYKEVENSNKIIDNAEKLIFKYEEKINVAKNLLTEDYAIATLISNFKNLEILGYVFNLLNWDEKYRKAIIVSGNEWMKAIVVKDIKSMVMLAEFSKNKGIPFLKIIPVDILYGDKLKEIPKDPAILGILSEFVHSDVKNLSEFLFGNIILAKNPITAYILSKQGYKAVSITGEIFFPKLSIMQFNYNSRISDLTKDILMSGSIEKLKDSIEKLKKLIEIKSSELDIINEEKSSLRNKINSNISEITNINKEIMNIHKLNNEKQMRLNEITNLNKENSKEIEKLTVIYNILKTRFNTIEKSTERINNEIKIIESQIFNREINFLINQRNKMKNELETINKQINQMTLSSSLLKNNIENINIQFQKLTLEKDRFEIEKKEKTINLEKLNEEKKEIEIELTTLRNKENIIIQSFNSTYTKLQEYDNKIKKISENERRLTKELNHIEKETAIIKKDIIELENRKINLTKELNDLGYKETLENFEIENLYQEIREELETIKDKINLRADETYLEIIDGYRGMSNKRNQLEEERNSIVNFIEEIGKEKENVFSNAFEKVDEDIRKTFSEITGGNAWLEFENPENIFSGGILLMVQFPNKPARESTSLSGGEKTMAAIVFLLALQSLKPSPFYLMDEVDAHLDAQNTDRLSKILLLRSYNNQIIMVTLKDSTVAKSDIIFGVYPKNGISQVIRYNHPSKVKPQL